MAHGHARPRSTAKVWRKVVVPALVVGSVVTYAVYDHLTNTAVSAQPPALLARPAATAVGQSGKYKDGVYTGPSVNAYYGLVQVQATVQSGKLANVQFLAFPNDRRTSQQINGIVMPYLQQEALQAQSAHVNIISGATLTSEAFAQSLNGALNQAINQL